MQSQVRPAFWASHLSAQKASVLAGGCRQLSWSGHVPDRWTYRKARLASCFQIKQASARQHHRLHNRLRNDPNVKHTLKHHSSTGTLQMTPTTAPPPVRSYVQPQRTTTSANSSDAACRSPMPRGRRPASGAAAASICSCTATQPDRQQLRQRALRQSPAPPTLCHAQTIAQSTRMAAT